MTLQEIKKIPQIGPKSANRLIIAGFDSLKEIALASPEENSEVLTIPKISANRIIIVTIQPYPNSLNALNFFIRYHNKLPLMQLSEMEQMAFH